MLMNMGLNVPKTNKMKITLAKIKCLPEVSPEKNSYTAGITQKMGMVHREASCSFDIVVLQAPMMVILYLKSHCSIYHTM